MTLNISDTFNKELPADPIKENYIRQVTESCFSFVSPTPTDNPSVIHVSDDMLLELGISEEDTKSTHFLNIFSGKDVYEGTQPYAMCYGGHQFGNWAGQLGDGRAINLFEITHNNKRWALQLKGAGRTPYSRNADGLAVLRSSIREYLCSEAMFHLGVPTTRALSLILSGEQVLRDILYNGNAAYEKGAIVCRVAPSFIRFGNFQILSSRKDFDNLKRLTDYTIKHFFPHLGEPNSTAYIQFFKEVVESTQKMVLEWERVGFVHGVMNTDNMSILGLTIDYGPYGWLENYDPVWTPNTTDAGGRRYRFGNQASVALWNLLQLANALYPIIGEAKPLEDILKAYQESFKMRHNDMMRQKLGLNNPVDDTFISELEELLYRSEMDMTLFFRNLSQFDGSDTEGYAQSLAATSYIKDFNPAIELWLKWLKEYAALIKTENRDKSERMAAMNQVNPKYVLRNYMAQLAIDAADNGDFSIINELFHLLKKPYDEQPDMERWFAKRPDWARHKVGCSMLSCSS